MSHAWDAGSYDRVSDVQDRWAEAVLARLPLAGDETVLDAGCGSGRVTRKLLERLPRGHVIAVDASEEMTAHARATLPADRATVIVADLARLALDAPVDAAFSNAVFHWVPDHDALFARLRAALRPGGRLEAQCGGAGNLDRFWEVVHGVAAEAPYAEHVGGFTQPAHFEDADVTEQRLRAAGFAYAHAWLEPVDATPAEAAGFIRTVNLRCMMQRLPPPLADPFIAAVLESAGEPLVLDYQRLNISATA